MNKKVEILVSIIIISAILIVIFQFTSFLKKDDLKSASVSGNSIFSFFQKAPEISEEELNMIFEKALNAVNEQEKYLQFIHYLDYHSVTLVVEKKEYYFKYDSVEEKIVQITNTGEEIETDFTMKITAKEYYKLKSMYEEGDYKGLAIKILNQVPGKVKINFFKQCMDTEWCKQLNF